MDPSDPLSEIINSGQAFSPAIALERFLWFFIGLFFITAISKSIINKMKLQNWFNKSLFLRNQKNNILKNKNFKNISDDDK